MNPAGFELTISTGERPQTYALDLAATGTGHILCRECKFQRHNKIPVHPLASGLASCANVIVGRSVDYCNLCHWVRCISHYVTMIYITLRVYYITFTLLSLFSLCEFLLTVFALRVLLSPYVYLLILFVFVVSYVYLLYYVCIAVLTLDAGLLARSQYPEGPATGHLDTGFSWFPCVYKRMLR